MIAKVNVVEEIVNRSIMSPFEYYKLQHSEELYLHSRHLYVSSSGEFSRYIKKKVSSQRPITNKEYCSDNKSLLSKEDYQSIKSQLVVSGGYSISHNLNLTDQCDELIKGLESSQDSYSIGSRKYLMNWKILKEYSIVRNILKDRNIKSIADNYLGCNSIVNIVTAWKTSYVSPEKINKSGDAMLFHFDCDHPNFLKLFIYLDDVSGKNGPHVYIPNTSSDYRCDLPPKLQRDGRISNLEILDAGLCPKVLTGKKGTMIFANTHNLHRGTPVSKNKVRYILQIQYVSSPFGAKPFHSPPEIADINNFSNS